MRQRQILAVEREDVGKHAVFARYTVKADVLRIHRRESDGEQRLRMRHGAERQLRLLRTVLEPRSRAEFCARLVVDHDAAARPVAADELIHAIKTQIESERANLNALLRL